MRIDLFSAAFKLVEDDNHPCHWASLLLLETRPEAPEVYVYKILAHFRQPELVKPPFNWCVKQDLWGLRWVRCETLNLFHHVLHHQLVGATFPQLLQEVSLTHSTSLDPDAPLWDCHVFSGLRDGRIAIYFRIHHVMFDAQGKAIQMAKAFGHGPRKSILAPWQVTAEKHNPSLQARKTREKLSLSLQVFWEIVTTCIQQARYGLGGKSRLHGLALTAPNSSLTGKGSARRQVVTASLSLPNLQRVSRRLEITLNDLFLLVCGGTLRHFLTETSAVPQQPLMAFLPISVRGPEDGNWGNKLTGCFANSASHLSDLNLRIELVRRSTQIAKELTRSILPLSAMGYWLLSLIPAMLTLPLQAMVQLPSFNFVLSNFQYTDKTWFVGSCRVTHIYPINLLFPSQGLILTFARYQDQINLSLVVCSDMIANPDHLLKMLLQEFRSIGVDRTSAQLRQS